MNTFEIVVTTVRYVMPILLLSLGTYFALRLIRAVERKVESKADLAELRARLAELEEARETSDREMMRLQAAHEFSVQLLAARTAAENSPPTRL